MLCNITLKSFIQFITCNFFFFRFLPIVTDKETIATDLSSCSEHVSVLEGDMFHEKLAQKY